MSFGSRDGMVGDLDQIVWMGVFGAMVCWRWW